MPEDQPPEPVATLGMLSRSAQLTLQIVAIVVGDQPLILAHRGCFDLFRLPHGWSGLLAFSPGIHVVDGDAAILRLERAGLVKLQAFVDQAMPSAACSANQCLTSLAAPRAVLSSASALKSWYVTQVMSNSDALQAFARFLRQSESYRLVCFLLEQSAASEKLCSLARRYGVSVSHFRRLCHEALGGAAKPEMREWRTAQALLAMARGKQSLTDVALEFGFASSSHFSKEIRDLVGVTPSSLIDITRLSSK